MSFSRTEWTDKEEKIIIDNYGKLPTKQISKLVNKTVSQINGKVGHLRERGFIKSFERPNNPSEIDKYMGRGLDLNCKSLNYRVGTDYKIITFMIDARKPKESFQGILTQSTHRHLVFKGKWYSASFLKADILMGVHQIKEVK